MNTTHMRFWDILRYHSQTHGKDTTVIVTSIDHHSRSIHGILRTTDWIEEQRIIPMSNDSIHIEKATDPNQSNQLTTTENQFLLALNNKNYAPILQDLLNNTANHNEYLLPTHIKQFKNRAFGFPAKIEVTDKIRLPMWVMLDNGKIDVVYVYLSDSDWRFHVSPWFDGWSNRLIKWDNFGLSYVTANRLDPEIEKHLHTLYGNTEINSNFPKRLRWFTWHLLAKNDSRTWMEQYQYKDFRRSIMQWAGSEVFRILWFHEKLLKPSEWFKVKNINPQDILNAIYSNDTFFRSVIDFSKKNNSYNHAHAKKGNYQVQVYTSYLAWRTIEWHIGEKGNDVWLDNIFVRVDNPLNAYGVHWISIDAGWLISKPWEYKSQVGQVIMNHSLAHEFVKDINDSDYISVEPFLMHSPIIRLYKEYLNQAKSMNHQ